MVSIFYNERKRLLGGEKMKKDFKFDESLKYNRILTAHFESNTILLGIDKLRKKVDELADSPEERRKAHRVLDMHEIRNRNIELQKNNK